ncbi:hypothetical protein ACN38_g9905 [Penicillium nordicum]|uniref:Uncharacterized protein n=1 Tax=Penicillium nordicum TaxID=229535 RepID=A0A0M8P2E3_9EURO|nr:hypothetical protein ACN38_g9905 [Penicillium nordicum]
MERGVVDDHADRCLAGSFLSMWFLVGNALRIFFHLGNSHRGGPHKAAAAKIGKPHPAEEKHYVELPTTYVVYCTWKDIVTMKWLPMYGSNGCGPSGYSPFPF